MGWRYLLVPIVTDPEGNERPDVAVGGPFVWVRVPNGPDRIMGRCIVQVPVADGTATTNDTLADLARTEDGAQAEDVTATNLTLAQRNAIKTRLAAAGFDTASFDGDGVDNRRKLLVWALRRLFGWPLSRLRAAIHDNYVGGG